MLQLTFNGSFLNVTGGKQKETRFAAVSGKAVDGKFDYSVARQQHKNEGPIPAGKYYVVPSELRDNESFLRWLAGKKWNPVAWGRYRISIHHDSGTETYGRSGFFIHGGDVPGSIGCIDLHRNMNSFVDHIVREPDFSGDKHIELLVRYA